jgi:pimeloyl-ACP methyl ester carboxylesterase
LLSKTEIGVLYGRLYNVQHWAEMTAGGHFAALEEPEAFAQDVGQFFRAYV